MGRAEVLGGDAIPCGGICSGGCYPRTVGPTVRSLLSLGTLVLWASALAGCPPDLQPPTPDGGRACVVSADCNPAGVTCGDLYLCVHALCEATPSQVLPCAGTGMRP